MTKPSLCLNGNDSATCRAGSNGTIRGRNRSAEPATSRYIAATDENAASIQDKLNRPAHGWVVVAAAFTLMFVGFGVAYSFAAFFTALQSELGASRAHVALVFSVAAFVWFVCGAPGGVLAGRFGR